VSDVWGYKAWIGEDEEWIYVAVDAAGNDSLLTWKPGSTEEMFAESGSINLVLGATEQVAPIGTTVSALGQGAKVKAVAVSPTGHDVRRSEDLVARLPDGTGFQLEAAQNADAGSKMLRVKTTMLPTHLPAGTQIYARRRAVKPGDTRLVLTHDGTRYRLLKMVKTTTGSCSSPYIYTSPVGAYKVDCAEEVTPGDFEVAAADGQYEFRIRKTVHDEGGRYSLATSRFDLGIARSSSGTDVDAIVYTCGGFVNANDLPSEARLEPRNWCTAEAQAIGFGESGLEPASEDDE
jgi:hypothetical protein